MPGATRPFIHTRPENKGNNFLLMLTNKEKTSAFKYEPFLNGMMFAELNNNNDSNNNSVCVVGGVEGNEDRMIGGDGG